MTALVEGTGDVLAWTDIETTGLEPSTDRLLEVACILTDTKLNELAEPLRFVVRRSKSETQMLRKQAAPYVQQMHDRTGLWDDLPHGTVEREDVDATILRYIHKFAPNHRQARLAGSSVHFDRSFLEFWAPDTIKHLHCRMLDVSSVAYAMENSGVYRRDPDFISEHAALADIRASIGMLRRINAAIDARSQ